MATYHSTRSHEAPLTSKEAIRRGIAPDGGLYVSDELGCTQIPLAGLSEMGYLNLAREVLAALLTDYAPEEIAACVSEAYEETFADTEITPVKRLAPANANGVPTHVLELWHGPTSAFKDVALQMLPRLMARTGSNDGAEDEKIMIVTATSGDTGKAALAGFADAPGVGISVFYPEGKVSRVQELQMSTQEGANVAVCGVRGNFDDAQTAVKQIFADREFAEHLGEQGVMLSSANSINVGRLVPQVVYYFAATRSCFAPASSHAGTRSSSACRPATSATSSPAITPSASVFPWHASSWRATRTTCCSTFSPRVRTTASAPFSPQPRRPWISSFPQTSSVCSTTCPTATSSSSPDSWASWQMRAPIPFPDELLSKIQEVFACGWADEDEVARAIKACWDENGYLIDPHTACGYHVLSHMPAAPGSNARVLLSTANPYKFPRAVAGALGLFCPPDDFACMQVLEKATGTCAPAQLAELQDKPVLHTDVVDIDGMASFVEQAAGGLK